MRKVTLLLLRWILLIVLRCRYRIRYSGEELLCQLKEEKKGILFLPNHTAVFIDPIAIALGIFRHIEVRPVIVEYMYNAPGVRPLMRFLNALPMPNFNTAANSLKKWRGEQVFREMVTALRQGAHFLIYPSGRLKRSSVEQLGGASAVHHLLQEAPEVQLVLVRISGLWGSHFSRALTGATPSMGTVLWEGVKAVLKNGLFFTPKRDVLVEFELAPSDFPRGANRLTLNHYLERWYNRWPGVEQVSGSQELAGEPFAYIPMRIWGKETVPGIDLDRRCTGSDEHRIDVGEAIRKQVHEELRRLTTVSVAQLSDEMDLATDLGLDSLDLAEVGAFIHDRFDRPLPSVDELTTVGKVLAFAAGIETPQVQEEVESRTQMRWKRMIYVAKRLHVAKGESLPEAFLNYAKDHLRDEACGDERTGALTYRQVLLRVILLAEFFAKQPGHYVGVMLPASTTVYLMVLALQLAGKVPVMVNWTLGARHLQAIVKETQLEQIFTSWSFVERLNNVEFAGLEERFVMLEDVRHVFGIGAKVRAALASQLPVSALLQRWTPKKLSAHDEAVILFTSGTESTPKGVPLTHENILSNQRGALETVELSNRDVMLGMLPPFHAFGFTASGLLGLVSGLRMAYSPDPTDGKKLAEAVQAWSATMLCGAPSFLRGLFRGATREQIATLRYIITGAEKAPPELFEMAEKLGKGSTIYEGYGITECGPVLTLNRPGTPMQGVGRPLPDVELLIVNPESYEPVGSSIQGLVLARGPNIFRGYLNSVSRTPFIEVRGKQWYNTGDLGVLDKKGYLTLSGRQKRFVKVGGEMVSLTAIEEALNEGARKAHWFAADAEGPQVAVAAEEREGERPLFHAFVCFDATADQLTQLLRSGGVSNLVKIHTAARLEEIPLMGSGKINYRHLSSLLTSKQQ